MPDLLLVTPENWFALPQARRDALGPAPVLSDAAGHVPLASVALAELRALHFTFGGWCPPFGDALLSESRALLRRRAEAALADPGGESDRAGTPLAFPGLGHPALADSAAAMALLRQFLWLPRAPSLLAWARTLARDSRVPALAAQHAWLRLLLQRAAAEDDDADAVACLRAVYAGDDAQRAARLDDEARVLEACGMTDLVWMARRLGLDRPARTDRGLVIPPPERTTTEPPDVTVLVPAYRHEAYIGETLASVLAQTYPAFRVVVVDDRSPDDTVTRAQSVADPRVEVRVNDHNLGLGDSVLRALDTVDTPFVALLNSDDVFHPERLSRCRAAFAQSPRTQVVATGFVIMDDEGRTLTTDTVRRLFDGRQIADWVQWQADTGHVAPDGDLVAGLLERNFLVTSSNIVARTAFLRGLAESLRGLKYCLDWQVFLAAAAADALVVLPEPLLGYRLHGTNTVWFDDVSRTAYRLEVNRVIAESLRQRRARAVAGSDDDGELAHWLEQLGHHASRHSDASGVAMYANALVDGRRLEDGRARSAAVREQVRALTEGLPPPVAPNPTVALAAEVIAELRRQDQARFEAEALRLRAERDEALAAAERATAARAEEVARLRSSPEWLVGDRVWNRAGGARIGRPMVKALHTARDRRNRWRLTLGRLAHRVGLARPQAVVAACWSFPIHSQTFVYQEMTALAWAGFDCTVFCCDTNPRQELPAAFGDLWDKKLVMQTDWVINQRDLEHFQRTRPARFEALLVMLAAATGLTREGLLNESIVRTGFTFARHVELAGAAYIHTYFFYDQSFLGLIAAYLLQIPRGITAYADHMLGDYQFKCVPLHLELADIVVATSRRIKVELGAIGAGRFDDKILVKANGIDVARFPHVLPATRLAGGGIPEIIAVNRIEPKKGLLHLIDAMGLLKARDVAVRLNLVGGADVHAPSSADCYQQLLARIAALQLGDLVVLHGVKQQHEFAPLLARSRLFVAPYVEVNSGDKDGIPTAVLEAMATGLPVVATDAGSIHECVADGVEGLQVPQRDAARLAEAIERLLTDRDLFTRMSNAARQRAVGEFDIHVTELKLHNRIRACLAQRG